MYKGVFRKETHIDSHAHRGATVVALVHRARQRPHKSLWLKMLKLG
jgi:hypothetical protein